MWSKKVTIKTDASKEQIWNLWSDVKNWNKWDEEIKFSHLDGDFEVGTLGVLKPTKGPKSKFKIYSTNKPNEFTAIFYLPLTKAYFTHELIEKDGQLYISHGIEMKGVLSFLFSRLIGENLIKNLPTAMEKLSQMAKNS